LKGCLVIAAVMLAAGCATSRTPPPATRDPSTTPAPKPTPPLPPIPAAALPSDDTAEPLVRVLLDRTSDSAVLPQPGRAYRATWDGGADWLWGPITIEVVGHRLWQVGAFRNADAARDVEKRLGLDLGDHIEVRRIAGSDGLVRVQVGWRREPPGDPSSILAASGFPAAFMVTAGGRVVIEGQVGRIESDGEVVLEPQGDWPTAFAGRRYRGRFRALGVGSDLLLINELNMERYLMGVVPVEMGPAVFPELEALKAQAVAARTYAVAHLGDHDDEGYDICATPACQAYHGAGAEHRLSDRAVEETAGVVAVFDGAPIDAMYTSTCGGHTEDAARLFPDRAQPYLTGVACAWERPLLVAGTHRDGPWLDHVAFRASLAREILELPPDVAPAALLRAVLDLTGAAVVLPAPTDPEDFASGLLTAAGLDVTSELTRVSSGLESLLVLCDLYGAPLDPPTAGLTGDWPAAAVAAALQIRGTVVHDSGEAVPHTEGIAIYPRRAEGSEALPNPVSLWESWGQGYRRISRADVLPGTHVDRLRVDGEVEALIVRRSGGDGEADRRSAWRSWIRERSWSELGRRLELPDLEELEVVRRGSSGRVVEMVARGRSGTERRLEGFPIRRALDLPENLFWFYVVDQEDGRVVRFFGRGWGHGVGLCQNGSYGLARAGRDYAQILSTYYQGISLEQWP